MTIAYVSSSASGSVGTSTTVTVNAPTSITAGNLLLAFMVLSQSSTGTAPSGWTQVASQTGSGGNEVIAWSKTATGSEPANYTFTASGSGIGLHVAIVQYSGNEPVTVGHQGTGSSTSGTTWSNPSWTATGSETSCWSVLCLDTSAAVTVTGVTNQRVDDPYTGQDLLVVGDTSVSGTTIPAVNGTLSSSAYWTVLAVGVAESTVAPSAPTLTAPGNAAYLDGTGGVTFTGIYNSNDGADANARAMRLKASGASSYTYYNTGTGAFQSTIVWNSVSIAPGASASFGPITLTDGQTVNWSMADQESKANLQGPFASDFTLNLQQGPTLTVTGPSGTVTTATVNLTYTATPGSGSSITGGRWLIYTYAATQAPGFSIDIATGTIPAGAVSDVTWTGNPLTVAMQAGVTLANGTEYVAFAAVTETGTIWSSTLSSPFTVTFDAPAAPTVTATQTTDPVTGCPMIQVTVQGHDNLLSAVDASFETGIGTWVASGATLAQSSAHSDDGSHSMSVTATAAGSPIAQTSATAYSVTAGDTYTAVASFLAGSTGRSCQVELWFYGSGGGEVGYFTSTAVTDTTSGWTQASVSGTAPSTAVTAAVIVTVLSVANTEVHYVDNTGIFPGVDTTWTAGGFVGSTTAVVTRSDVTGGYDGGYYDVDTYDATPGGSDSTPVYVRGASQANPATVPAAGQQVVLNDYEVTPGEYYQYTAQVFVVESGTTVASPVSAATGTVTVPLSTYGWWWVNPLSPSGAVMVNPTSWQQVNMAQASAHMVMGQDVMNMINAGSMKRAFQGTLFTADGVTYGKVDAIVTAVQTIFISSPFSGSESGYYVVGPDPSGLSMGTGTRQKTATLNPQSTGVNPQRDVDVMAVAAARPSV